MSIYITPGTIIHTTYKASGMDALTNLPDLPCRATLVTGEPSSYSGLTPVYVFGAYGPPFGATLDTEKVDTWHPVEACIKDAAYRLTTGMEPMGTVEYTADGSRHYNG